MDVRLGLQHPCPNNALHGLASDASAGAVWLLKSPEVQPEISLEILRRLVFVILREPQYLVVRCDGDTR
ncbi:hypothetical protein C4Q28_20960 [Pseudomonas sp. SWI6]|nr:hypothetical protein C4Q28_20960 [Pseudomonas sp. SWI6]AVD86674.1 hypothetical protein C4Q26_05745 [Pseudomonas sp. SWI44]MPT01867.1 hypothetical protein [Pseudomonas sp.]